MTTYSLGIELSTQSAKMVVLNLEDSNAVYIDSFNYDSTFPQYNTRGGVLQSDNPEIRHTSPFMLLEALDLCFTKLKSRLNMSLIKAIKTDCMQHCSVYVNNAFGEKIRSLNPGQDLKEQLGSSFTRQTSPIWEDRSTYMEAEYMTNSLKEKGGISRITGNRAELRFPAAQILKWVKDSSHEYEHTSSIFVLSAFITSILSGRIAPVDTGDGWGTNLNSLDINKPGWNEHILSVIDSFLHNHGLKSYIRTKIGNMDHYDAKAGIINPYFAEKYGVNPKAVILIGTGDNPATLLGCGGNMVVSLGSSYTVNGIMKEIAPSLKEEYNIFGYTRGNAMALSVFTNGGKVHEFFLNNYFNRPEGFNPDKVDWLKYEKKAGSPLLSANENLLLPYLFDETVPLSRAGIIRDGFSDDDPEKNIRALILSQVLSLKLHTGHLGNVNELCVAGGGAGNKITAQWIADAFNAQTYTIENASVAAPTGCAVSSAVSALGISYTEAVNRFVRRDNNSICKPVPENVERIKILIKQYSELERNSLSKY